MTALTPTPDATPGAPRRNLRWAIAPLIIFTALAAVFALALRSGDPSRLPSALIGKPAPAIDLAPLDGLTDAGAPVPGFKTADLATGKPVVVNFWASWCAPCIEEHPLLLEARRRSGVAIFGVNYKDQTAAARRFLGRYGNPFAAVGVDAGGRAAIEWGVYGMPETFVIDGKGRIAFKHVGPLTPESLEKKLLPAIAAAGGG
jgi:cytochrome c biogenesis protein CcmG/thiol:disulfide interchange protein DsbE